MWSTFDQSYEVSYFGAGAYVGQEPVLQSQSRLVSQTTSGCRHDFSTHGVPQTARNQGLTSYTMHDRLVPLRKLHKLPSR